MIFYEITDLSHCLNIIYNVCMLDIINILHASHLKGKVMNIKGQN